MTEVISLTIARNLLEELDEKRGDTSRSKFISKILVRALESRSKKGENAVMHAKYSQESKDVNICDGVGCNKEAALRVPIDIGDFGKMILNLCNECLVRFDHHKELISDDNNV